MKGKERLNLANRKSVMQSTKSMLQEAKKAKRNNASSISNNNTNHHNTSNSVINVCVWRRWNNSKSRASKTRIRSGKSKRRTRNGRSDG